MINDIDFGSFENNFKYTNYINNYDIVKEKLILLKNSNMIPNIIFHGNYKSGKKTILNFFINLIYNNNQKLIKENTLTINCSFNKGIKYIREDLKFFCKTIINYENGKFFKSIILLNSDKLTIDAQSALRRCIEIYSHNTRFFLTIENKNKLLKPIISRFACIYVINNKLHNNYNVNYNYLIKNKNNITNIIELNNLVNTLYNNSYSAIDIFNYIKSLKETKNINNNLQKYKFLNNFLNIKKEIKNEKILMFYLLNKIYIRCNNNLEI